MGKGRRSAPTPPPSGGCVGNADAEVMVRRSERALGQAIRSGQERGEIRSNGQHGEAFRDAESSSARDFFAHNQEMASVYAVTDDVTDAEFDEALDRPP